jgi:hypothetical protein
MWIFSRPLNDLAEADLHFLTENKVGESTTLEYKRSVWGASEADKRELLRDVSSMANAEGGAIIVGMDQTTEGIARELVTVPGAAAQADRITDSCLAGISERILGLQARAVPIAGGDVIVLRIPRSYRRPHMVTFEGRNDFWVRHDRQKGRMSIAEVKAAVTSTEDLTMKAERFIEERKLRLASYALAIIGAPLSLEDGRVDTSDRRLIDLLTDPPSAEGAEDARFRLVYPGSSAIPTLRGRCAQSMTERLEVFRSGHVEHHLLDRGIILSAPDSGPRRELFAGARVAVYVAQFCRFIAALRGITNIADPYLVTVSINFGVYPVFMNPRGTFSVDRERAWDDQDKAVCLGPLLNAYDERPSLVPSQLANRLWQGFHFEKCPYFDSAGRLIVENLSRVT